MSRLSLRGVPILIAAAVSLCVASPASADSVPIEQLVEEIDATLEWDPFRRLGSIWRGNDVVSLRPDHPFVVYNMTEVVPLDALTYSKGRLSVPQSSYEKIRSMLTAGEESFRRVKAIFVDPGHGGRDPGAIGASGDVRVQEKDVVLEVGRQLHALLQRTYPQKEVLLSRDDDTYVTLEGRTEMANAIDPGEDESVLFISIHANASFNRRARGYEVWYLPPEFRRTILDVNNVGTENRDILPILNTLKEEEITIDSVLLARSILGGLDASVGSFTNNRGLKEESWFVVRNARMPSVLVEVGFLTHEDELILLQDDAYLQRLARGIYNGVVNFIRDFERRG